MLIPPQKKKKKYTRNIPEYTKTYKNIQKYTQYTHNIHKYTKNIQIYTKIQQQCNNNTFQIKHIQ